MENAHVPKEPVLLIALMIMRHAKLSFGDHVPYLRMMFLHPERMYRALSNCGQRRQV